MFSNPLLGNLQARLAPSNFRPPMISPIIGANLLTDGLISERKRKQFEVKDPNITAVDEAALAAQAKQNAARAGGYDVSSKQIEAATNAASEANRIAAWRRANLQQPPNDAESQFVARQLATARAIERAQKKMQAQADERAQNGGNLFTRKFNY
jgi:hypothetical protein